MFLDRYTKFARDMSYDINSTDKYIVIALLVNGGKIIQSGFNNSMRSSFQLKYPLHAEIHILKNMSLKKKKIKGDLYLFRFSKDRKDLKFITPCRDCCQEISSHHLIKNICFFNEEGNFTKERAKTYTTMYRSPGFKHS